MAALSASLLIVGCSGTPDRQQTARQAYQQGMADAQLNAERLKTSVGFIGPVRNQFVPWRENLSLAEAIVEAVYIGNGDPALIVVTRNGEENFIDPRELLRGIDYLVEPGDIVEFRW